MRKSNFLIPVLILCMLLGSGSLLNGIEETLKIKKVKEIYTFTEGYYTDYEIHTGRSIRKYGNRTTFYLIYEYQVNGESYTVKTDYSTGQRPPIGSVRTVYFNPENPSEAVLGGTDSSTVNIWFGLMFTLVPVVMIIGILAINGKLKSLKYNIMDILVGSVLVIMGIATTYIFSGNFSFLGLFETAGLFALIPVLFIVCGIPTICRGLFIKHKNED